jgi:hypothetical protein
MNEKKENNNIINIEEIKKQKIIYSNLINKKLFNKNSIRKQKRLFQMQKRLALLNEEELSEIESDKNNKQSEKINNLKFFEKYNQKKDEEKISKQEKMSQSFNYICNNKGNLNQEINGKNNNLEKENRFINLENIIEKNNDLKNEENNEVNKDIDNLNNKDENKEEELSIKKKNTNPNTNDEDKSCSEVILYNEFEQNRKKGLNQNESIEAIAFTKIINEDLDENINIFSTNKENNSINKEKEENEKFNSKDFISVHLSKNNNNIMNNFNFTNIVNDNNDNNNDENEKNNSVIINEDNQNNNQTLENNDNNEEDENVELNISNLEIDINQINNDSNYAQNEDELVMSGSNSNEFAKKYLSSKSKSFIKFSNNLTARVAAHSLKNSPSYILALCPELLDGNDKKNLIKDNYEVTDAISEEMESETFTPRQSEKIDYSINRITIENNKSIYTNTNEYPANNTLRNKDISNNWNFGFLYKEKEEKKEQMTPKIFNKNKINKNRIKEIKDIDIELKNFSNSKNKKINTKSYLKPICPSNNNLFNSNNNNQEIAIKSGILKNSEKKNLTSNDNINIKIIHKKAKSLVNNSQINSLNLNNHSPKQVKFKLFDNKIGSNKVDIKYSGYKKKLFNNLRYQQKNYFSNDNFPINSNNNSQSIKKSYKKNKSNAMMINNLKLCKSNQKIKKLEYKVKKSNLKKNNIQVLSKSNPYKHTNLYQNEKNKKICYTEKANKSKNYLTFISHMKKNTPININNATEQNINHSKKLSQQFCDGYKFFMNSLHNTNNNYNNRVKEINKINIGLSNFNLIRSTPLSNYFTFNKNKIIANNNNNYNNSVTFIKKNIKNTDDKNFHGIAIHNKSKTSFISPSYQNFSKNKLFNKNFTLLNNNKSANKNKNNDKNNNLKKYIKKTKFNEIKKIVKDSSMKIIHKKINTIGNSNDLTKILNNNLNNDNNKQLKGSASNNNLKKNFNKHKIIMALQHIKFLPNEIYSKALNELYKSKKNLFIILVYTDSTQRYIFRGLYEVNSTDQKTANKLFAPGSGQNTININSLNSFFNYQSNNGEFVKTKFNRENDKKFGSDTIVVY